MKDSAISYDLVQQQQQQQQHSWNHQRQQQHQTHTTSVYGNHNTQNSQRNPIGTHQHHHPQQQSQQHAAQLGQYQQHQQLQSTAHHNTAAAAAAYYQQAHLYPTYQTHSQQDQSQQQQPSHQGSNEHQQDHHQHHGNPSVSASGAPSVVNAAVVAAAQQQHTGVHQSANTQAPALNHTGWSAGVAGPIGPQGHHAVVTDHSTLAYMTHGYQSHNTSVGDHHRTSNAPIGAGPQASSYTVDSLYNTPAAAAAAAAVAAYGYNNYNAAFFQTSNNGHHGQTSHPSPAALSGFWGHNQSQQQQQQRSSQTAVSNQASLQQQQQQRQLTSDQSYLHDPRLYYGRSPYGQGVQNFGQHHTQTQQPQSDVIHHRITTISQQQPPLVQHDQQTIHQHLSHTQQQLHHTPPLTNQQSPSNNNQSTQNHLSHQPNVDDQISSIAVGLNQAQDRKIQSLRVSPLHPKQQLAPETEHINNQLDYDHQTLQQTNSGLLSTKTPQQATMFGSMNTDKLPSQMTQSKTPNDIQQPQQKMTTQSNSSISPVSKPQSVIKSEATGPYQVRKQGLNQLSQTQAKNNNNNRDDMNTKTSQPLDSGKKSSSVEGSAKDQRVETSENQLASSTRQTTHSDAQTSSLESSMSSMSLGPRKTTWASIASQPAKVSQPKSLKSKMAGTNSVLSSAKHLSSVSMDNTSLDSKNGINPTIKSSVSTAATSTQRSSVPPPITKTTLPTSATLSLDLLGDNSDSTKISWPAVNASINLTLDDDPPPKKETTTNTNNIKRDDVNHNDRQRNDEAHRRDYADQPLRDHNHNQGPNKMVNSYGRRDDRRDDQWHRRDQRDYQPRMRRDSDRKEDSEFDKKSHDNQEDHQLHQRDQMNSRRDMKPIGNNRMNQFRGGDEGPNQFIRDRGGNNYNNNKQRGPMLNDRPGGDSYRNQRFPRGPNRFDNARDSQPHHHQHQQPPPHHHLGIHERNRQNNINDNDNSPHHHYNNIRDGNPTRVPQTKPDLNLHPHLNPANFNPKTFDYDQDNARYFIIKSYSEDDIHRSIKYSIWCSTNHGNKRLDEAYKQQQSNNGKLFLLFSVNGSGHFCGMAQMTSAVDFDSSSGVWAQSKWQGEFSVKWIYVKDVPNSALRHITLENNEDKPVTNSRDTQEVPSEKGKAVLKILHTFKHMTSMFDDFWHYERRQEEEKLKKSSYNTDLAGGGGDRLPGPPGVPAGAERNNSSGGARFNSRPYVSPRSRNNDFQPGNNDNRERPSRFAS